MIIAILKHCFSWASQLLADFSVCLKIHKNFICKNWMFVPLYVCLHAKSLQLYSTVCNFMNYNLPASSCLGCSRQEYWSGLPCPPPFLPPGDLPNWGIEPQSLAFPALAGRFFTTSASWEPTAFYNHLWNKLKQYIWWREINIFMWWILFISLTTLKKSDYIVIIRTARGSVYVNVGVH